MGWLPGSGCVAWIQKDERQGNIAYDLSGYDNHGTIYGASWARGKIGYCLKFDGVDDYVDCGLFNGIDLTQQVTLSAWVKLEQLPSAIGHIVTIIAKSGMARDLDLQAETDDKFYFFVAEGLHVISTTVIQTGQWYHVVGTYTAYDNIKIYVNGVLENTTTIDVARLENPNPMTIGQSARWPGRWFNGLIDEIHVYIRALSANEIKAHYWYGIIPSLRPQPAGVR